MLMSGQGGIYSYVGKLVQAEFRAWYQVLRGIIRGGVRGASNTIFSIGYRNK